MELQQHLQNHKDLYLISLGKKTGKVLFKLLSYEAYNTYRYILLVYPQFKFELEDQIWEECVIEHTLRASRDKLPAGIITTLAQLILYFSCPKSIDSLNTTLEQARLSLKDAREQAILTICEAFPSYLPEDLEKKPWNILIRRLAQAEFILKKEFQFNVQASQPTDDSAKILNELDDYTIKTLDFTKINQELQNEEFSAPRGDFNLHNARGR